MFSPPSTRENALNGSQTCTFILYIKKSVQFQLSFTELKLLSKTEQVEGLMPSTWKKIQVEGLMPVIYP